MAVVSAIKMMKNAFYLTLKACFILKIFKFLSWFFANVEKGLDLKDEVNFKVNDVTTRKKTIAIHMLPSLDVKAIRQSNLVS